VIFRFSAVEQLHYVRMVERSQSLAFVAKTPQEICTNPIKPEKKSAPRLIPLAQRFRVLK
jgi:hypothetical protein